MNMNKGLITGSVFIDLAKAFDTVDHNILFSKFLLEYYGVCDESFPWFFFLKELLLGKNAFCAHLFSVIWSAPGIRPRTAVIHCLL